MKRSLILVMCDVLVLSAMSLSSGVFEEDARQEPNISSVTETSNDEAEDLRNQLASLKASVREVEERRRVAEEKAAVAEEKAAVAEEMTAVAEAKAKELGEEKEQALIAKEQALRETSAAKAETAEAKEETRQALEGKAVAEAKAKELGEEKEQALIAKEQALRETSAAKAETAEAKEEARQALEGKAVAEAKAKELGEAKEQALIAKEQALRETSAAKAETAEAKEETRQALEGKAVAEDEKERYRYLYEQYGRLAQERNERIERIKSSAYLVTVSRKKGQDKFYAPVINIEGNPFILARYEGKTLDKISEVILHGPTGMVYKAVAAYYGVEKAGRDIVLFEFLPVARGLMSLTLGQDSGDALRFWVSSQTGKVYQAPVLNADLKAAYKDYDQIDPGDLLIDSGSASIIAMALSRGSVLDWFNAKGSIAFDHPISMKDLTLWPSCGIGEKRN